MSERKKLLEDEFDDFWNESNFVNLGPEYEWVKQAVYAGYCNGRRDEHRHSSLPTSGLRAERDRLQQEVRRLGALVEELFELANPKITIVGNSMGIVIPESFRHGSDIYPAIRAEVERRSAGEEIIL